MKYRIGIFLLLVTCIGTIGVYERSNEREEPKNVMAYAYTEYDSMRWRKNYNKQEIEITLEYMNKLLQEGQIKEQIISDDLEKVKKELMEIQGVMIAHGCEAVDLLMVSAIMDREEGKYLVPYEMELLGIHSGEGPKVYFH